MSIIGPQIPIYHSVTKLFVPYSGPHSINRLTIGHIFIIQIPDMSGNQMPTVSLTRRLHSSFHQTVYLAFNMIVINLGAVTSKQVLLGLLKV